MIFCCVNEMHTNSYTGPRLNTKNTNLPKLNKYIISPNFRIFNYLINIIHLMSAPEGNS